jgi:ABC-type protease/lipase transport system fused ATPase/permease subunit
MLREHYLCPHFRILVIGRANAGKTTILEKVCGVAKATKPIIYNKDGEFIWLLYFPLTVELLAGEKLEQSVIHLMPSLEASQIMMYEFTHLHAMIIERPAWYWASNYIPWE